MNYLYHYTSLETLALILKNRTICFNNLLYVDDIEEQRLKIWKVWKICICKLLDRGFGRIYTAVAHVYA